MLLKKTYEKHVLLKKKCVFHMLNDRYSFYKIVYKKFLSSYFRRKKKNSICVKMHGAMGLEKCYKFQNWCISNIS